MMSSLRRTIVAFSVAFVRPTTMLDGVNGLRVFPNTYGAPDIFMPVSEFAPSTSMDQQRRAVGSAASTPASARRSQATTQEHEQEPNSCRFGRLAGCVNFLFRRGPRHDTAAASQASRTGTASAGPRAFGPAAGSVVSDSTNIGRQPREQPVGNHETAGHAAAVGVTTEKKNNKKKNKKGRRQEKGTGTMADVYYALERQERYEEQLAQLQRARAESAPAGDASLSQGEDTEVQGGIQQQSRKHVISRRSTIQRSV
ncbi:unnamed protein product [Amoebophrya sp. A120]|nr:unnamed protein product [Amoebophrya sp. A120]|eukprot:GSA120T00020762001.1